MALTRDEVRAIERVRDTINDLDLSDFTDFNSSPVKAVVAINKVLLEYAPRGR